MVLMVWLLLYVHVHCTLQYMHAPIYISYKNKDLSILRCTNCYADVYYYLSDELTSNNCKDCSMAFAGIAFKLTYNSKDNNEGFFSHLFIVPPKLEFGLPTQYNCSVDLLMLLNSSYSAEGLSYRSTCLELHLGLFPFRKIDTVMYMFETCKLKEYCEDIYLSNMANIVIWGYLPQQSSLGHFMELLPISPTNKALVATVSKKNYEIQAQLFNIQFSLFDSVASTAAFINEKELRAVDLQLMLFGNFPANVNIKVEQVDSWDKASLYVVGKLIDNENNIPAKLESYIEEYLELLYNRFISKFKNAEAVFNNSILQQQLSENNQQNINNSKNLTDRLYQEASTNLENQAKIVDSIEDELQNANNQTRELQKMIDNLCTIRKCDEICIPQKKCEKCKQNVSTLLQSQCNIPCTDIVNISVIVGYKMECEYRYIPGEFCTTRQDCSYNQCVTREKCEIRSVCRKVYFEKEVYGEIKDNNTNRLCTKPCPKESVNIQLQSECCASVGCTRQQNDNCTRDNEKCDRERGKVYSELLESQNNNALLLQRLDEAKESETGLRLKVQQFRVRKSNIDQRYNESIKASTESKLAVHLASSAYKKLQKVNNVDLQIFQNFQTSRNSQLVFDSLKIKSMTFNATLVSNSPKVLQMLVAGSIEDSNFTFSQTITVDFNRLETSLRDAASKISEDTLLVHNYQSPRSSRSQREIEAQSNMNYYTYQVKCTDLQNVIDYLININESLKVLHDISSSSITNATQSRQELIDMIDYYTIEYHKPITINVTQLREAFNIVVNASDGNATETYAGLSTEELLNLNIMKEHLNASDDKETSTGTIFIQWQHKMEELHNLTSSAGGHNCISFADCLQKLAGVVEDILIDSPHDISKPLLQNFPKVSQDLIRLSLLRNSSLQSAIEIVANFSNLISSKQLLSYWCAKLPIIVDKSEQRITPLEDTKIELFCKANSTDYVTYRWRKNGVELLHQQNSTLIVHNTRLHDDSGNYTCEITNQVGTIESTGTVVDVQQLPWFFLQPENLYSYIGDTNDAIFKCNASGWPYPGFNWFFRCLGCANYIQIRNEDENELVISNPQPYHEGSYFTEAVNEKGNVRSRIVNFMALKVRIMQLSQSFSINFTSIESNSQENSKPNFVLLSKGKIKRIENQLTRSLHKAVNITFNTMGNFSISATTNGVLSISFTLYSRMLSYFALSHVEESLSLRNMQARIDWIETARSFNDLLATTRIHLSIKNTKYNSDPNSIITSLPQYLCPPGMEVSSTNSFLCGKLITATVCFNCVLMCKS